MQEGKKSRGKEWMRWNYGWYMGGEKVYEWCENSWKTWKQLEIRKNRFFSTLNVISEIIDFTKTVRFKLLSSVQYYSFRGKQTNISFIVFILNNSSTCLSVNRSIALAVSVLKRRKSFVFLSKKKKWIVLHLIDIQSSCTNLFKF